MADFMDMIENPLLVAAMQAVKKEDNRVSQAKVTDALLGAQLLIPVTFAAQEQTGEENGKGMIQFHMIQNTAKQKFFLAFTSLAELQKWRANPEQQKAVLTFDDYAALVLDAGSDAEGIAIDPMGSNLVMTKDMVKNLRREKRIRAGGGIDLSAIYPKLYQ